jgi:hypothetical protein
VPRIHRALISVSDKHGLAEFASVLDGLGIEILSTGGTLSVLQALGISAHSVSSVTGYPEILDGRVKTLHPAIHGALLAVADNPEHLRQLEEHGIAPIDMVVVNLYPFAATVARPGVSLAEAVEQIDIGGPGMLRSAAKNFRHKAVIVSPAQYAGVIDELRTSGGTLSQSTCAALAREVFHHTARYDATIAAYLDSTVPADSGFPPTLTIAAGRTMNLRYGENPHQHAALYGSWESIFTRLHGKELSYNNIVDASAAALLVAEFDEPTVAIVKHTNPCGVGSAATLADAYERAFATDTKSPFGGIVAVNRPLDLSTAEEERPQAASVYGRSPCTQKQGCAECSGRLSCAGERRTRHDGGGIPRGHTTRANPRRRTRPALRVARCQTCEIQCDRLCRRGQDAWRGRRTNVARRLRSHRRGKGTRSRFAVKGFSSGIRCIFSVLRRSARSSTRRIDGCHSTGGIHP